MKTLRCIVCHRKGKDVNLKSGIALENTWVDGRGNPTSQCSDGTTLSQCGLSNIVDCLKCPECGHSVNLLVVPVINRA